MSGHSKWSSIKHQKGVADARRGQLFTKLTREIIVAVRQGGSNPESNFRLRLAIQKARDSNMPLENIERAIKRGSGELEGVTLSEMVMEGYGPGGTAILVQALTDNRNRTIQEIRNIFARGGGSLGESGSVTWLFNPKGLIRVETGDLDTEELTLQAIDAGADDVKTEDGYIEIYTRPDDLEAIRASLEEKNVPVDSTELTMIPKTTISLEEKAAIQTLKLLHKLEELDEIQGVYSNVDFPDAILEKYQEQT
ncbi:MAG: YebC/PmpR family DNA-binding transcriptional regulator [Dehalococcoidales bacterium]|nr:YebC/PmpR family DNA-binding transcriptional regulator [Dehalococcoidales bacterium]